VSRLAALSIPFVQGHTDEINPKLLPNGVFAEVNNGRLPQIGGLRLRRGWRPITMLEIDGGTTLTACDLHSYGASLVAMTTSLQLAAFVNSTASRPWRLNTEGQLSPVTQFRTVGNIPELDGRVLRASAAVSADGAYGCTLFQTATRTVVRVFNLTTDETVYQAELSNGANVRKVVSAVSGTRFGLVENTGSAIRWYILNPTGTTPEFVLSNTFTTGTYDWFDVATAYESAPSAVHLVTVDSTGLAEYRQFNNAGTSQTGSTKTIAATDTKAICVCSPNDARVHCVFQKLSDSRCSLVSFSGASPFTTSAGPTELNAQTIVRGRFSVTDTGASGLIYVASERSSGASDLKKAYVNRLTQNHATNDSFEQLGVQLYGGHLSRGGYAAAGFTWGVETLTNLHYGHPCIYQSLEQPWMHTEFGLGARDTDSSHIPFWPGLAPTGDALVITPIDRTPEAPSDTTPALAKVHALKVASTERRPSAQLGNALYITGGVLTQWANGYSEVSMVAPSIQSLVTSNGSGTLTNSGAYRYLAQLTWQDEAGRTQRSDISREEQVTLGASDDTVVATVDVSKTLRRSANLITNPTVLLYRTEAGPGELFYLVGSAAVSATVDSVSITDTTPDSSIISAPGPVTQGEFGATSGVLPMCPARPSSYVAATKRRLILGSADTSYQWSQVSFPETQIWFAEPGLVGDAGQAYFDDVEAGRVTGVAALDETVFVGTAERIYVTGGTGPNLAGTGEFSPPIQLPSDVGFFNAQSILETSEGLWFLGSLNTFYLLARGTPTPQLSRAVQDRLTAAVVGCGYDHTDNVAVWATSGATAVVRQLDTKQWFGDSLPFTPIALHGHQGHLYAVASDGVVWKQDETAYGDGASGATAVALRVTTGAVQPFEMSGWGRLAAVEVLGEFETAAAILGEISYDDGKTWTSLGTHTVTGLASGEAFQRQWHPARQRGDRFRFRLTMTPSATTGEGCRLAGLTLYYTKKSGPTRLDSAKRR